MIKDFLNQPFHLLDQRKNRWLLIVAIGLYTILFMNLYLPFNVNNWYKSNSIPLFFLLSGFGVIGMIVLTISQFGFREIFKIKGVKMRGIILWFFLELVLLTLAMFFIYGTNGLEGSELINELFLTFKYTTLVLIIPYGAVLFYLYATKEGENIGPLLKASNHLINILDENGDIHMSIEINKLLYIQSADNYVAVFYLKDDKINKELVRTSLKRLENELDQYPIRRCHRSFMVNITNVTLSTKSNQGLSLSLRSNAGEAIPVSKNYKAFFLRIMKEKENQEAL